MAIIIALHGLPYFFGPLKNLIFFSLYYQYNTKNYEKFKVLF